MWVLTLVWSLMAAAGGVQLKFPPGFEFGVSSSAYQIEGAWNVSGKGESVADRFAHTQRVRIQDASDGDSACDSYRLWRRDLHMLRELGVHFYRFSISWSRLLPTGLPNRINQDGVRYYNDLLDGLKEIGVKAVVTLYHNDLPQRLQDLGGWVNPLISDWFADYAHVAYQLFGDRVDSWVTINEPILLCHFAYGEGTFTPGPKDHEIAPYLCAKHVMMSHAKAWRLYDEEFRGKFGGTVSIVNIIFWMEPTPGDETNKELAETALQFSAAMYSHPIYSKEGGWPHLVESLIADLSQKGGHLQSRLPAFSEEERELVRGTHDYYALNYYTGRWVRRAREGEAVGAWPLAGFDEFDMVLEFPTASPAADASLFFNYPEGFRKSLQWIKDQYGDLDIAILENGFPETSRSLEDYTKISYIKDHLEQIILAVRDGVNVVRYSVWSLMDSYEWTAGYTLKFGLYDVDFAHPLRTRTARKSAHFYNDVIKAHSIKL